MESVGLLELLTEGLDDAVALLLIVGDIDAETLGEALSLGLNVDVGDAL